MAKVHEQHALMFMLAEFLEMPFEWHAFGTGLTCGISTAALQAPRRCLASSLPIRPSLTASPPLAWPQGR